MTHSTLQQREELEAFLPPADRTRENVRQYCATLDITLAQFAHAIGRSHSAVRYFVADTYTTTGKGGTDLLLRQRIEDYIARHPVHGAESTHRLYDTDAVRHMREVFERCHRNRAFAALYAPPGSGKTYIAEALVAEFNRRELADPNSINRAYLVRSSINIGPRDMLALVCREVGVPAGGTVQRCLSSLRLALRGKRVTLIVDELQLATIAALEGLRELHDVDKVGMLFLGSHRMRQYFEQHAAELEQFHSRMDEFDELRPLSEESARVIVSIELPQLKGKAIAEAVKEARVDDIYSREAGRKVLSARRLAKIIKVFRDELAAQQEVVQ